MQSSSFPLYVTSAAPGFTEGSPSLQSAGGEYPSPSASVMGSLLATAPSLVTPAWCDEELPGEALPVKLVWVMASVPRLAPKVVMV